MILELLIGTTVGIYLGRYERRRDRAAVRCNTGEREKPQVRTLAGEDWLHERHAWVPDGVHRTNAAKSPGRPPPPFASKGSESIKHAFASTCYPSRNRLGAPPPPSPSVDKTPGTTPPPSTAIRDRRHEIIVALQELGYRTRATAGADTALAELGPRSPDGLPELEDWMRAALRALAPNAKAQPGGRNGRRVGDGWVKK
jgi:hypothetical protein